MSKLSEMGFKGQLVLLLLLAAALTGALYFAFYKTMADANHAQQLKLQAKMADIRSLRPYENKLADMNRQIDDLKQQLERMQRIVPDEKDADQFMHMIQSTAADSGIEIRRYTAKPAATREFYTEVPFDLELDGPYYRMLEFFQKVAKLERIINVTNLQVGALKVGEVKTKKTYPYAPGESVVATCTASTFFSSPDQPGKTGAATTR